MSNNQITSKIIIDVEEYFYLKSLEQQLLKKNDEIKKLLEEKSNESGKVQISDHNETKEFGLKEESGPLTNIDSSVLTKIIHLAQSQLDVRKKVGEGGEEQGLLPELTEPIEKKIIDPNLIATTTVLTESKQSSKPDEDILLQRVPTRFHLRAKQLLSKLLEDPNQITFDTTGTLIIDNQSIPNSNIFIIFPKLFVPTVKKRLIGYQELLNKIAELNLGSYINKKLTKGFHTNKAIENRSHIQQKIKENKQWWFLGN